MKLTATYPLPIFGAHTPHYRYFFNGQEADNEVYGEEAVLERGSAIFKRLPSIRSTTTTTYRISTHNGMRATMSFPRFSYLETVHSPQGNNIPMSTNNIQAQVITLLGDGCQFYTTKIEDRVNTPSG